MLCLNAYIFYLVFTVDGKLTDSKKWPMDINSVQTSLCWWFSV